MDKLASLPLHAAGIYRPDGSPDGLQNCVSGHVICSYTPSLSALIHEPIQNEIPVKVFALGAGDGLTCTNEEVETVVQICSARAHVEALVGNAATTSTVRAALQDANIAHFACHGKQDLENPLRSRLSISNTVNIQVEDLMKDPLPKARLAVLFACETAQGIYMHHLQTRRPTLPAMNLTLGDQNLTDEALHLAGTMLFAGFSAAVGTLWSMDDEDGPEMSKEFYSNLMGGDCIQIDFDRVGYSLHRAVEKLRDSGVGLFRWVPFVHIGR